ncbi:AAA family ATPase (plasmid) [Leisingera aquaemixtae]|uniref:AAA family ATPase n=1 Tax=Leisingera aquaemixtae TaxID=1396826 RepID=UPI0021A32B92|nr:AAA family ATPase [Leisingera aquaemixtae]UWQ39812.1 AAA family ATPase [Leisingera aquaemixtae]
MLTQEEFEALTDEERDALEEAIESVQQRISDVLKSVPKQEKAHRRQVEQLNYQLAARGVDEAIPRGAGRLCRRAGGADLSEGGARRSGGKTPSCS